jgi:hypothetical protein
MCYFDSNDTWVRHVIADSFLPSGSNTMSPGTPQSFYPSAAYANEILPDGRLDLMKIKKNYLQNKTYDIHVF